MPKIDQINYIAMLWRPMVRVFLGRLHQGGRCFSSLAHGFNEKELNQSWLKLATYRINQLLGKKQTRSHGGICNFYMNQSWIVRSVS